VTWSHIFSIILGGIESVQLCSVVLYFFWYSNDTGGNFTFPVVFLFDHSQSEQNFGVDLAMGLAACSGFIWIVIVALPLIFNADNASEREKMRSLQRSPVFEFFHILFSRVIFVSIIVTLMRPFSCIEDPQGSGDLVMSTDWDTLCGGQESFFSGSSSSVLLIFFVITSISKLRILCVLFPISFLMFTYLSLCVYLLSSSAR